MRRILDFVFCLFFRFEKDRAQAKPSSTDWPEVSVTKCSPDVVL